MGNDSDNEVDGAVVEDDIVGEVGITDANRLDGLLPGLITAFCCVMSLL